MFPLARIPLLCPRSNSEIKSAAPLGALAITIELQIFIEVARLSHAGGSTAIGIMKIADIILAPHPIVSSCCRFIQNIEFSVDFQISEIARRIDARIS